MEFATEYGDVEQLLNTFFGSFAIFCLRIPPLRSPSFFGITSVGMTI